MPDTGYLMLDNEKHLDSIFIQHPETSNQLPDLRNWQRETSNQQRGTSNQHLLEFNSKGV